MSMQLPLWAMLCGGNWMPSLYYNLRTQLTKNQDTTIAAVATHATQIKKTIEFKNIYDLTTASSCHTESSCFLHSLGFTYFKIEKPMKCRTIEQKRNYPTRTFQNQQCSTFLQQTKHQKVWEENVPAAAQLCIICFRTTER